MTEYVGEAGVIMTASELPVLLGAANRGTAEAFLAAGRSLGIGIALRAAEMGTASTVEACISQSMKYLTQQGWINCFSLTGSMFDSVVDVYISGELLCPAIADLYRTTQNAQRCARAEAFWAGLLEGIGDVGSLLKRSNAIVVAAHAQNTDTNTRIALTARTTIYPETFQFASAWLRGLVDGVWSPEQNVQTAHELIRWFLRELGQIAPAPNETLTLGLTWLAQQPCPSEGKRALSDLQRTNELLRKMRYLKMESRDQMIAVARVTTPAVLTGMKVLCLDENMRIGLRRQSIAHGPQKMPGPALRC